jgi:hypothetical protein
MTLETLERRLAVLEKTVAELVAKSKPPGRDDWRSTIGMFTGDAVMKEIDEEALKYREENRQKTRP